MNSPWDKAKSIEREGREYYRARAQETSNPEIAGVLRLLADEEQRHYDFFAALEKNDTTFYTHSSVAIAEAREAFSRLAAAFQEQDAVEDAETTYAKALEMEKASVAYYERLIGDVSSENGKKALTAILEEEKNHVHIVQGLLEFVRRPREWLENAEFTHLEEY
jgi:rubrerythrin